MSLNNFTYPLQDSFFEKFEPVTQLNQTKFFNMLTLALFGGAGTNRALISFINTYIQNNSGTTYYFEFFNPIFTPFNQFFAGAFSGGSANNVYNLRSQPAGQRSTDFSYANNLLGGSYPTGGTNEGTCRSSRYTRAWSYSFCTGRVQINPSYTVKIKQIGTGNTFYPQILNSSYITFPDNANTFEQIALNSYCSIDPTSLSVPIAFEVLQKVRPWIPILFETTHSTFYSTSSNGTCNLAMTSASSNIKLFVNGSQKTSSTRPLLTSNQKTKTTMIPWFRGVEGSYGSSIFVGIVVPSSQTVSNLFPNSVLTALFGGEYIDIPLKQRHYESTYAEYVTSRYIVCEFDMSTLLDRIYSKTFFVNNKRYIKISFPYMYQNINSLSIWRK